MYTVIHNTHDLFSFLNDSGLLAKYGILKVGVFGSFAREEKFNDIDLLIEDEHFNWKKLEAFRKDFHLATGIPLDIMVKAFAEPVILNRALKDIKYG
jgi:predicted nucleotidyltransferase